MDLLPFYILLNWFSRQIIIKYIYVSIKRKYHDYHLRWETWQYAYVTCTVINKRSVGTVPTMSISYITLNIA